ncbi:MAG: hypothetical protein ACOX7K_09900 [Oscillospiraceae bacterium]
MEKSNPKPRISEIRPAASGRNPLEKVSTYQVDGKKFIVTPIFQQEGRESFGSILMRMMKADVTNQL